MRNKNNKLLPYLLSALIFTILLFTAVNLKSAKNPQNFTSQNPLSRINRKSFQDLLPKPTLTLSKKPITTLIFTGDVIPARSVNMAMVVKNDFTYPFKKTADFLKKADLTIINLEAPLIKNCPQTHEGMNFCGDQRFIAGLLFAGVDIAGVANNHIGNYGSVGITQTSTLLNTNGIQVTGLHNIVYETVSGTKFAFIAFNGVAPFIDEIGTIEKESINKLVAQAQKNSDVQVILFHWGKEYSPLPVPDASIAPADPVAIGHFAIEAGADLVIGNHPHVVQGYEIYQGKPIFYALGNFIFDQMWSYETRIGNVLKINYQGADLQNFSFHPVRIDDYAQPVFLDGEEKESVIKQIQLVN